MQLWPEATLVVMSDVVTLRGRDLVERHRDAIRAAARRHHGHRVRVFGSTARQEDGPDSDIDFLVDFDEGSSLFDVLHLTRELEELLGRDVDVVSTGGLKPRDQHILDESLDV